MRRLSLLLVLLLLPLASAQTPESATVTVTAGAVQDASLDKAGSASFTVQFDSQNPLDGQNARDLLVTVSGAPEGWTYELSDASLELTSGQQASVTVRVAVNGDAKDDDAAVTLTAQLAPYGADVIPVLGPILDASAEGSATATVERQDTTTREVIEAVGPWLYVILAALLIAIIIVIKMAVDTRKILVALETDGQVVHVGAGKSVAVPVTVRNLGQTEDTVVFHVMTVAQGWAASLPVPELDLDGGAAEELQLIVHAPKNAEPGSEQAIGITAHSGAAPRRIAEAVIHVVVS